MLTFDQITELISLVAQHRLRGVTLEREGFRFEVNGYEPQVVPTALPLGATHSPAAGAHPSAGSASPAPSHLPTSGIASGESPAAPASDHHVLTSPIVGTFYAAPSPDSDVFVRVGDRVKKGQVLCIVEAMKLMNEIESDVDGTVVEVFPKNAQPVEYGEPLFAITEG